MNIFKSFSTALSEKMERAILWTSMTISLVILVTFMLQPADILVRYLSDDAYYYFQVAKHISAGHGPTFDGITWTTGFHPLYAMMLIGIDRVTGLEGDAFVTAAMICNVACFFLTGLFIYGAAKNLWSNRAARWGAILWYSNPHAVILVGTGMEGSLYALTLAALAYLVTKSTKTDSKGIIHMTSSGLLLGAAASLCILSRTDALIFAGLTGIYLLFMPGRPVLSRFVQAAGYGAAALLPLMLWFWYCGHSTGNALQGSAEMKTLIREGRTEDLNLWGQFMFGFEIFQKWIVKSIVKVPASKFFIPFFITSALSSTLMQNRRRHRPYLHILWISLLLLGIAYSLLLPRAWTWYYAPSVVFLTLLSAGCLFACVTGDQKNKIQQVIQRILPLLLIFITAESYAYLLTKGVRGRNRGQIEHLKTARWLKENLPEGTRVGAWNAGITSWYSELQTINLDGLINNDISARIMQGGRVSDYIKEQQIEYLVDRYDILEDNCPEWTETDVKVIHFHESAEDRDRTIWKVNYP